MNFKSFISNPFLKTILTVAAGAAATAVDQAIQNPTGGMAQAMASNPSYAMAFAAAALFVHNLISHIAPSGSGSTDTTTPGK